MRPVFQQTDCLSLQELQSYHQGELRGNAARKVEEHLVDCPLCSGALDGMDESQKPRADEKQLRSLPYRKPANTFRLNRVAAILLLSLIALPVLYFWPNRTAGSLFDTYYQTPQPPQVQLRGNTPTPRQLAIEPALVAFQRKDYPKTLLLLEQHLQTYPDDPTASFWQGIAQLETNNPDTAILALQRARQTKGEQIDMASWYLLLAYLKKEDWVQASQLVKELPPSVDSDYATAIQTIQKKLGRLQGQ